MNRKPKYIPQSYWNTTKKLTRVLNQLTESVLHNSDEAEEVLIENNLSLDEIKNEGVIFMDNLVVTNMLKRMPFVKWDRFAESKYHIAIYGWIERDDNYFDFIVVVYDSNNWWYITSSKKYSTIINDIISGPNNIKSADCQRVEDYFCIDNYCRLTKEKTEQRF